MTLICSSPKLKVYSPERVTEQLESGKEVRGPGSTEGNSPEREDGEYMKYRLSDYSFVSTSF